MFKRMPLTVSPCKIVGTDVILGRHGKQDLQQRNLKQIWPQ